MNDAGMVAIAQLFGIAIGLLMERGKQSREEVASPTSTDRRISALGFLVGSATLIAVTAALIGLKVRYTPLILSAMCISAWLYFPLSAANVDEDDDRPVPYREAAKLTFIACTAFANLAGLAAFFWLRHTNQN